MIALKRLAIPSISAILLVVLLLGCGGKPLGVPGDAQLCSQGDHPGCTAPQPGGVWVYDRTGKHFVYQGALSAEQDLSVDPAANQVTVDGNPVATGGLQAGHSYEIYFAPSGRASR